MAPRTPAQYEQIRAEKRHLILEASLEVFAQTGYHSATVSAIAKQAGISKGLIYNYFESKEEILVTLLTRVADEIEARFLIGPDEVFNKARIREFIHMQIDIVLEDPQHWKLYFALFTQPSVVPLMMEKLMARAAPMMQGLMGYFSAQGYEDPMAAMRYFSATIDGIQMHLMLSPNEFPIEPVKKMLIKQFAP